MMISEHGKTFIELIYEHGFTEGVAMAKVEAKARAAGKAQAKAEAVLKLLDARGLAPSEQQRGEVKSCDDPAQLDLWFDRAITASTAAEVFAE